MPGCPDCATSLTKSILSIIFVVDKGKDMNTFEKRAIKLRKDIIAYIEDFLTRANRSIIVPKGNLTYMEWDASFFPTNPLEHQVVPEVEIAMICLSPEKELRFIDVKNNELLPGALDTEELLYVVEYIDTLDLAPVDEQ